MNDSIYSKTLPATRNNRLMTIARNATKVFFANMDEQYHLNIIYKTTDNQIVHIKEENNTYNRKVLLDDKSNVYNISNLQFICFNNNIYLFYTANNPYDNTYDLIFHNIYDTSSSPQSLLSMIDLNAHYELTVINHQLTLLCITKNEAYELNLYTYDTNTNEWQINTSIKQQSNPITYATLCNDQEKPHILYMSEQFGQNQLYYTDIRSPEKLLYTSPYAIEPSIFKYQGFLWVNWLERKEGKFICSVDNGTTFGDVNKGSIEEDTMEKLFFTNHYDQVYGNRFYGTPNPTLNLFILSQIDVDNILLNNNINKEMKILLNNLVGKKPKLAAASTRSENDVESLKNIQENIIQQYNELSEFAKQLQEEGKKWRGKYNKAEIEIKRLKKEIDALKSKNTSLEAATSSNEKNATIETKTFNTDTD